MSSRARGAAGKGGCWRRPRSPSRHHTCIGKHALRPSCPPCKPTQGACSPPLAMLLGTFSLPTLKSAKASQTMHAGSQGGSACNCLPPLCHTRGAAKEAGTNRQVGPDDADGRTAGPGCLVADAAASARGVVACGHSCDGLGAGSSVPFVVTAGSRVRHSRGGHWAGRPGGGATGTGPDRSRPDPCGPRAWSAVPAAGRREGSLRSRCLPRIGAAPGTARGPREVRLNMAQRLALSSPPPPARDGDAS